MDLSRLLRQPIVVEHVDQDGAPDEMGDPTEVKTYTARRGWVWQTQADELTANTQVERTEFGLALERSAAGTVLSGDRILVDAILDDDGLPAGTTATFDVDGPPWNVLNPRTQLLEFVQARIYRST